MFTDSLTTLVCLLCIIRRQERRIIREHTAAFLITSVNAVVDIVTASRRKRCALTIVTLVPRTLRLCCIYREKTRGAREGEMERRREGEKEIETHYNSKEHQESESARVDTSFLFAR